MTAFRPWQGCLPDGDSASFRASRRSSTGTDVLRAESSLQGGEMSYLKVHPRYYIDARKGFAWGRSSIAADDPELDGPDWHCFVIDREKSGEVHEMTSSSFKADLDRARTTLLKWLDEHYPDHRDPFAYWTDCEPAS